MYIIDLKGKEIKVTDLQGAIEQAKLYTTFGDENSKNNKYWTHALNELMKLEEPKPVEVETVINGKELPQPVIECRKIFTDSGTKGFIKNDRTQPLYSIHSCARSERKLRDIDMLEIGESTNNSTPTKITRVY